MTPPPDLTPRRCPRPTDRHQPSSLRSVHDDRSERSRGSDPSVHVGRNLQLISAIRVSSVMIAVTSSTNRSAAIICSSHARTCRRSGAWGEVIGALDIAERLDTERPVKFYRDVRDPCSRSCRAGSQRGRRRASASSIPSTSKASSATSSAATVNVPSRASLGLKRPRSNRWSTSRIRSGPNRRCARGRAASRRTRTGGR